MICVLIVLALSTTVNYLSVNGDSIDNGVPPDAASDDCSYLDEEIREFAAHAFPGNIFASGTTNVLCVVLLGVAAVGYFMGVSKKHRDISWEVFFAVFVTVLCGLILGFLLVGCFLCAETNKQRHEELMYEVEKLIKTGEINQS